MRAKISWEQVFADLNAARAHISAAGKIAVIGYCWGGTIAWRSATQVNGIAGAVCYYGTLIAPYVQAKAQCPMLMHFGERDPLATLENAGALRAAQGAYVEIQVYAASHGFNCDQIANFDPPSSALALRRTLDFLKAHIG